MKKIILTAAVALTLLVGVNAANAAFTWNPGQGLLKVGVRSQQVVELQQCLADLGNNPAYNVDGIYGNITASAVRSFQANYNLENPGAPIYVDGIIGPQTGPLYVVACADADADADVDVDEDEDTDEDADDSDDELSGGEASLESFSMDSEDDAEEGEMTHVATIEFDVENGDAMIDRLDLAFDFTGAGGAGGAGADDEPWDVFESITLMVDGEEVAEAEVSDEDDWSEEDTPFEFRFSGLDYIVEEDETAEIEVWVTAQNNVDGIADATWTIFVPEDGIRAEDSEGIQNYIGDGDTIAAAADEVKFIVDKEGGDESIEIKSSASDPDASSLLVEDDEDSEWLEVFVYELKAEESDIEINDLGFTFTTVGGNYDDLVEDVKIEIDGEEFDDFDVVDGNTLTAGLTFDIDGDFTVDADTEVDVTVFVKFKEADQNNDIADGAYDDAGVETITISATTVDGEGDDDVEDTDGGATSETHTLTLTAATVSGLDSSSKQNDAGTVGTFTFTFDVTAEGDEDVEVDVDDIVEAVVGGAATIGSSTIVSSDAEVNTVGNDYTVLEGDTASFTLTYTINPGAGQGGTYYIDLQTVAGMTVDEIAGPETLVE